MSNIARIHNVQLKVSLTAGVSNYAGNVNCPFVPDEIHVTPPVAYLTAGDTKLYEIRSQMFPDNPIIGLVYDLTHTQGYPIVFKNDSGKQFRGIQEFIIRESDGSVNAAGAGQIYILMRFIKYKNSEHKE